MAATIRLRSSGRSCGRGGRKTETLTYLHKKNPRGIKLGELVASEAAPGVLQRVWTEMDYRPLDICRVTQSGHIQYFRGI